MSDDKKAGAPKGNKNACKDGKEKVDNQFTVYVTKSKYDRLKTLADSREITLSRYINLMTDEV